MPTLDWIGKEAVVDHHREVPFRLLRENEELSAGNRDAGNLLVQGDNLLALKALLPYYAGQVKCIYIDPPYNTGNEGWVYNDAVNSPEIRKWLGEVVGREAEDLSRHDKWLCMMYPRLMLLKEFLREDGSIWISIDDAEVAGLRMLMDEIFGRSCFVAANVWQKRYSRENREAIGDVHEYIVVYAPDPERFKNTRNRIPLDAKTAKVYKNLTDDPKGRWRPIPMTAQGYRPNQMYPITTPAGVVHRPPEGRCWSTVESEYEQLLAAGRIYFGKDNKSQPNVIRYLSEVEGLVPWTWWPHEDVGHTDEAKKELYAILGKAVGFDTPKPTRLLQRVLQIATDPGDIVLDSFAGSGTTGHAVMQLNALDVDSKPRRVILCEMDDKIARSITSLRLRRASDGYGAIPALHSGFRYCELDQTLFDGSGGIRPEVSFEDLARHVFFVETGEPLPKNSLSGTPLLGVSKGTAIYLLYNGILKDRSASGGNALTRAVLETLPPHDGPRVVYGTSRRVSPETLRRAGVVFKQTPYDIRIR
jgi:adenine-specific DNA-methyltransferase